MSRNKSCEVFYIIKKDQYLHWILKWYVKSITSTCIPLNPDVLMNNKCKNSKKKQQYLHWLLKWYVKRCTTKNTMFACIPLNLVFLLNNECKKINIYIEYLNDMLNSAQVKLLCLLVYL